jgi:hypothetical protein
MMREDVEGWINDLKNMTDKELSKKKEECQLSRMRLKGELTELEQLIDLISSEENHRLVKGA